MLAEERQSKIEQYLVRVEFASLDELSEEVDVSVSTVRRDLAALESRGVLRRTHGGARLINPRTDEFTWTGPLPSSSARTGVTLAVPAL